MSFNSLRRRRSMIHRRDGYSRSIQGRREPECRDSCPQSVRGQMNPEYRELRLNQRTRKIIFLFKPMWMVLCVSTAQAQSRSVFCLNQTSGESTTAKEQLQKYKPALARSSQDYQLAGNNERPLRLRKASSSTPEGDGGVFYFPSKTDFAVLFFVRTSRIFSCIFSVLSKTKVREARIISSQGCKSGLDANQMCKLLYQDRSAHRHLDLR